MSWEQIHDTGPVAFARAANGQLQFARAIIFDKGEQDILGRYVVAKYMRGPDGQFRNKQTNYRQRPAAIRYANAWIEERRAKSNPVTEAA